MRTQIYLLPDKTKSTKRKTKVVKKSVDPDFDETFSFSLTAGEPYQVLNVAVWDYEAAKQNSVIGEVEIPLASILTDKTISAWYALQVPDELAESAVTD